ncbi:helix-turn-helix domain-containing protein [Spirosoma arcticum]
MSDLTDVKFFLASLIRPIVKEAVREEFSALTTTSHTAPDEVGGIELARQVTRLSAARIYTLVSERKLPHKKRGNRLAFRRSELLNWLDEGNRETIGGPDA